MDLVQQRYCVLIKFCSNFNKNCKIWLKEILCMNIYQTIKKKLIISTVQIKQNFSNINSRNNRECPKQTKKIVDLQRITQVQFLVTVNDIHAIRCFIMCLVASTKFHMISIQLYVLSLWVHLEYKQMAIKLQAILIFIP